MLLAATASQRLDKNYPTLYTVGALMNCILISAQREKIAFAPHGQQVLGVASSVPT